jgi:hypothetical protein
MSRPTAWSIEYRLREDEDSMFVPAELLPHAQPGDAVEIRSTQPLLTRRGRVTDRVNDETRGEFVIVSLD